ncbi:MAG TPA: pyridoxamine 5'-phosphate oxidase family protein [Pseudomonadales bacterium]|nr:pyridoxamine 5'-phosphate oxidase family protein [Pseudomonadales bacterium]
MSELAGTTLKGPWDAAQVVAFLDGERSPLRLALTSDGGFPLVVSLWFRFEADVLWCATHESSLVARRLAVDPRVGFEVSVNEMPYRGVRGQARVELLPASGPEQLEALLQRYLGGTDSDLARWLLSRADGEVALRLRPNWLTSWDFSHRMKGL